MQRKGMEVKKEDLLKALAKQKAQLENERAETSRIKQEAYNEIQNLKDELSLVRKQAEQVEFLSSRLLELEAERDDLFVKLSNIDAVILGQGSTDRGILSAPEFETQLIEATERCKVLEQNMLDEKHKNGLIAADLMSMTLLLAQRDEQILTYKVQSQLADEEFRKRAQERRILEEDLEASKAEVIELKEYIDSFKETTSARELVELADARSVDIQDAFTRSQSLVAELQEMLERSEMELVGSRRATSAAEIRSQEMFEQLTNARNELEQMQHRLGTSESDLTQVRELLRVAKEEENGLRVLELQRESQFSELGFELERTKSELFDLKERQGRLVNADGHSQVSSTFATGLLPGEEIAEPIQALTGNEAQVSDLIDLKKKLTKAESEISALREQIRTLEATNEELVSNARSFALKESDWQQEIATIQHALETEFETVRCLRYDLSLAQAAVSRYNIEADTQASAVLSLQQALDEKAEREAELKQESDGLRESLIKTEGEVSLLRKSVAALKAELIALLQTQTTKMADQAVNNRDAAAYSDALRDSQRLSDVELEQLNISFDAFRQDSEMQQTRFSHEVETLEELSTRESNHKAPIKPVEGQPHSLLNAAVEESSSRPNGSGSVGSNVTSPEDILARKRSESKLEEALRKIKRLEEELRTVREEASSTSSRFDSMLAGEPGPWVQHALDDDMPIPRHLSLESPVIQTILQAWTSDRKNLDFFNKWCAHILGGGNVGPEARFQRGVELSKCTPSVRDGILSMLIPMLRNRKGVDIAVFTRERLQLYHDVRLRVTTTSDSVPE